MPKSAWPGNSVPGKSGTHDSAASVQLLGPDTLHNGVQQPSPSQSCISGSQDGKHSASGPAAEIEHGISG